MVGLTDWSLLPAQLFHDFCHFSDISFVARGSSSEAGDFNAMVSVFCSDILTVLFLRHRPTKTSLPYFNDYDVYQCGQHCTNGNRRSFSKRWLWPKISEVRTGLTFAITNICSGKADLAPLQHFHLTVCRTSSLDASCCNAGQVDMLESPLRWLVGVTGRQSFVVRPEYTLKKSWTFRHLQSWTTRSRTAVQCHNSWVSE